MKEMVKDVLQGENRLLYTYGVTNSGKTYTIQGTTFSLLYLCVLDISVESPAWTVAVLSAL